MSRLRCRDILRETLSFTDFLAPSMHPDQNTVLPRLDCSLIGGSAIWYSFYVPGPYPSTASAASHEPIPPEVEQSRASRALTRHPSTRREP